MTDRPPTPAEARWAGPVQDAIVEHDRQFEAMQAALNRGIGPGRRPGGGHPAGRSCDREFALLALTFTLLARYAVLAVRKAMRPVGEATNREEQ